MKKILIIIIIAVFTALISPIFLLSHKSGFFEVGEGESLIQVSNHLKKEGFLKVKFPFSFYVYLFGHAKDLKSGVYLFHLNDSVFKIANKITEGDSYKIKSVIPEGFNLQQIQERLSGSEPAVLGNNDLKSLKIKDFQDEFSFLKDAPEEASLEGFLFPDTYDFYPQRETKTVAAIFLSNFDKKLTPDLREKIKSQGKKIFEVIIMASLIEKEVKTLEDKKIVSGILWKRLNSRFPLQVDATVAYALGEKTSRISINDTKIDSPYNTYKYKGLPIGPISNPGLESIVAAIEPQASEFWYYLSGSDGKTYFSKTLSEHNLKKYLYINSNK